jgi:outer membrane receptor protein involved in Fe transport
VFVDDTFRVNDRVSFNLGLRYDYNKAYSAEQQELDELANPTGRTFPKTDLYTWKTISPRLGFNVKLTADGKTVLKGHWGRYHRAVATGEYANVIGPSIKATYSGLFDFSTNNFDPASLELFESNENLSVDPNYKSPYNDQFILSLERELFRNFGINANYVYKRGRQLQAWEETNGQYVTVPFVDDVGENPTGDTIDVFRLVSEPGDRAFRITNPAGVFSDVHAVSVNLLKRMSDNWLLNSSVTWLRGEGRLQESSSGVGISQRSGLQFRDFGKNPNDFVNTDGRLRLDVTWLFKTQLVWQLPAGFLVSGNFMYRDGAWLVRRARVPASVTNIPEGTVIFLQKRGENGRIQSVTMLDARVQKDFKLGSQVKLSIFADALNLLNEDAPETVQSSLVTSSTFNWPFDPVDPRRVMVGAKLKF